MDALALTKLDVLDDLSEVRICTGYRVGEEILTEFPADLRVLAGAVPQYETLPGWSQPTREVRSFDQLPTEAKAYIKRLEELAGVPFAIISTGTDRHDTLLPPGSILDTWFDQ